MKSVDEIKTVAGIGGGVIGGSWAVLFAMKGYDVNLYDINDDCIANDAKTIESNLDFLAQTGAIADKEAVKAHIHYTTSMEEAVKDAAKAAAKPQTAEDDLETIDLDKEDK